MFFAEAAAESAFAALLKSADFVTRLGHLAVRPEAVVLAAVALRDHFMIAALRLAGSLIRHCYLSGLTVTSEFRLQFAA